MEGDVRLKHPSRSSGRKCTLKICRGTRQTRSASQQSDAGREQRHVSQDSQGEQQWERDTLHIQGVSAEWWSLQGEKYSMVAFTCNHRKERLAFLRTSPLLLRTDTQPGRLQALPIEPGFCFSTCTCQILFLQRIHFLKANPALFHTHVFPCQASLCVKEMNNILQEKA